MLCHYVYFGGRKTIKNKILMNNFNQEKNKKNFI